MTHRLRVVAASRSSFAIPRDARRAPATIAGKFRAGPAGFFPCGAVNGAFGEEFLRFSSVSGTAQLLHQAVALHAARGGICRCRRRRSIRTLRERVPRGTGSLVPIWGTGGEATAVETGAA